MKFEVRGLYNPQRNILDGDLLWKYLHFSLPERTDLAKKIGTTADQVHLFASVQSFVHMYALLGSMKWIDLDSTMSNFSFNQLTCAYQSFVSQLI